MANDRLIDLAVTKVIVTSTVSSPLAPTVAELTATSPTSVDITSMLTSGTEIDWAESDTVTEMSFSDGQEVAAPSMGKYVVNLVMFRLYTSGVLGTLDPSVIFTHSYPTLYVYKRVGLASSAAVAASQKFDVFKITADKPITPAGVGGFVKMRVKGLPQGFSGIATVAA